MPVDLVERIVEEITAPGLPYKIVHSHVGENGEATLHPDFIEILRVLKRAGHEVGLYTNLSHLDSEKARIILEEGLLEKINFNIDGLNEASYRAMKGLELDTVTRNVIDFIKIRKELNVSCPIAIHIITAENYLATVLKHFRVRPHKLPLTSLFVPGEAERIKATWEQIVGPNDNVGISPCLMWAERGHTKPLEGDFECFNKSRLYNSAFIAPNGDWYACCFDVGNELVMGNVYEQSLVEIFEGEKLRDLREKIEAKQFKSIGPPCDRVDCCQVVGV